MSKKDNGSDNKLNLGDIGMIRNILMGEQINDFESRFKTLQDQITKLESHFNNKLADLGDTNSNSLTDLKETTSKRFDAIEKQIADLNVSLNAQIDKVSKNDKLKLGRMLEKISKQLIGE